MLFQAIKPMLLHKSNTPPPGDYIHQLKYDGFRCLLHFAQSGPDVQLYTRNQNNCTLQFPEFSEIRRQGAGFDFILDGEMISLGDDGKPDFEAVMRRFRSSRRKPIQHVHFAAFDVLHINGRSVMTEPLEKRLDILQDTVKPSDLISVVQSHADGAALFASVQKLGLEGIVSKKKGSRYILDHRTPNWLKTKNYQFATVTISGIRKNEFGWALLMENGDYAGVCEFVPSEARSAFARIAKQLVRSQNQNWHFLEPLVKCRVKYQCLTKNGLLRSPSFVEFVFKGAS